MSGQVAALPSNPLVIPRSFPPASIGVANRAARQSLTYWGLIVLLALVQDGSELLAGQHSLRLSVELYPLGS